MPTSESKSGSPAAAAAGLFGRDREMAVLMDGLERARSGAPSTILLGGDAGIGKTRLLSEFVSRVSDHALWGGCLPMGERGVPFLPLIEMLRSLDPDVRQSLPPALDVIAPGGPERTSNRPASRAHVFQAVIDLLGELASQGPVIVVVEDIHWADRSTRDLIDFVIGLLHEQRILLVASFRSDDMPPDHPLRLSLAEWIRRPSVDRIDLEPLSSEAGLQLVAQLLTNHEVTREQALGLVARADGNPFFIEELAASGPFDTGPPQRMRDLLLRRTHRLDPDLLRLLRVASAGGTNIDEDLLSRVAAFDLDTTQAFLRTGIDELLLTIDHKGCRFRHALLAETLHDDLLPLERREFHGAYADALKAGHGPVRPGELAAHLAEAGRVDEAVIAWVAAGHAAESQFAFAEAVASYKSALERWDDAIDPVGDTGSSRIDLLRRLAETAFLAGDARLACDMAREAVDEIDADNDPVAAALVHQRLARYVRNTNDRDQSLAIQERAVALVPKSPPTPERAEVVSGLALILQFENRYHDARDLSKQAIDVAVATGAIEAEVRARNTLGETVCVIEDLDRGLALIEEALDLAQRSGNAHEQARSLWNMQANRFFGGRMADFVANSSSTIEILRYTQPHWIPDHMVDTADALQMIGRWDEADEIIEEVKRTHPLLAAHLGVPELLVARQELGKAKELVAAQAEILVGFAGPDVTGRVLNLVNRADIALAEGDAAAAIDLIQEALERYPDVEKPIYISQGLAIALRAAADLARNARIKAEKTAVAEAIEIGENLYEVLLRNLALPGPENGWRRPVGCLAAQCDAERSRLHGRIDPDAWRHAELQWQGLSMPYRAAYCAFRWSEDALTTGAGRDRVESVVRELAEFLEPRRARLLLTQVKALARRAGIDLGGGRPVPDPFGLTVREREVLTQIAKGSTNRQIADILFISEKTASVHVSNILRKLTAANRGEAAAKAIREGLVDLADLGSSP